MAGITDALNSFSQSLKRFNEAGKTERTVAPSESHYLQEKIRERAERLKTSVTATYRIYKAPFEALGEHSDRAAGIDGDEQALLEAYNLYKGAMELNSDLNEGVVKEAGSRQTFISKIEINSPLTQKSSYTSGGQFIYLMMWLYFEKNCRDYMPVLSENDGNWNLTFVHSENFSFENHDREIFEIVRQEFYEGEE